MRRADAERSETLAAAGDRTHGDNRVPRDGRRRGVSDRTVLVNASIGGVVSLLTVFVPLSPILGGALSGDLEGENGLRVGALSGVIASLPLTALGFSVTNVILGYESAGPFPGGVTAFVSVLFFANTLYSVGFGALGGYLSVWLVDALD